MSTIAEHLALIEALRLTNRNDAAHHESWLFTNVHWPDLVALMPTEEMRAARVQTEQRLREQHPEHAEQLIADWRSKRPAEHASGADLVIYQSIADNYNRAAPVSQAAAGASGDATLRAALLRARTWVEPATRQTYDGTIGEFMRAAARGDLAMIDAALSPPPEADADRASGGGASRPMQSADPYGY